MGAETVGQRRPGALPEIRPPERPSPSRANVHISGRRLRVHCPSLFDDNEQAARRFIHHAFALDEVESVAVRRERGEISIELTPLADEQTVWQRLGALVRGSGAEVSGHAAKLDLRGPVPRLPVRIARAGKTLTTYRARVLSREHMRVGHPQLRDRDTRLRFIELLRSVHGVSEVRPVHFRPAVIVTYDAAVIEPEHILRLIEGSWPQIIDGPPVMPPPKRLVVAGGLMGLSLIAQFFRPVLLPWATAAVVLFSLPSVIGAVRELRQGRVGLYALYTAGLGFLLWSRLPFASSVIATFRQLWPSLAHGLVSASERSLFADHRRRLAWARLSDDEQGEILVDPGELTSGSLAIARAGDFLPADGIVVDGAAAVDEDMLGGAKGATQKVPGDAVYAGSFVRDGFLSLRVTRAGATTAAAALARALPHGALQGLPSSAEAERIADRNAKPALLAAAVLLLATRGPRLSQVVIRPDYATAPRLSAHLSALTAVGQSLGQGALIRRPAALERLTSVDAFVFDDGLDFSSRTLMMTKVSVVRRSAAAGMLGLAAAALADYDDPRSDALIREFDDLGIMETVANGRQQRSGETIFWDDNGARVSVATPSQTIRGAFSPIASPALDALIHRLATNLPADPAERPLVVARDHRVLGVVQFARTGEARFAGAVAALRAQYPEALFVRLSSASQEAAEASAEAIGFDAVFGGLSATAKADALRSLGLRTAWIGVGADAESAAVRAASTVSISLGGLDSLDRDTADIVLLRQDPHGLSLLRANADAHAGRLKSDYQTVYAANMAALAGGFAAGFGSLAVGLTSNVGSGLVFLRRWRSLAGLSSQSRTLAATRNSTAELEAAGANRRLATTKSVPAYSRSVALHRE